LPTKSKIYTSKKKSKSCSNKKKNCHLKQSSYNNQKFEYQNHYDHYRTCDDLSLSDSEKSIKCIVSKPRKQSKHNTNNLDSMITVNDLVKSIMKINLNYQEALSTTDNTITITKKNMLAQNLEDGNLM
jgi:hypothetical protein